MRVIELRGRHRLAVGVMRYLHADRSVLGGDGRVMGAEAWLTSGVAPGPVDVVGDCVERANGHAVAADQIEVDADVSARAHQVTHPGGLDQGTGQCPAAV